MWKSGGRTITKILGFVIRGKFKDKGLAVGS